MATNTPLSVIVGLGNPGPQYEQTRHNAGFWLLDQVARHAQTSWSFDSKLNAELCRVSIAGQDVRLIKPLTYMNRSGQAVGPLLRYFKLKPEQVLVAHDELDLASGVVKLKQGGGHGGHNGLRDLISHLGGAEFWRLRLGIDHPGSKDLVVDYVLQRPRREQQDAIDQAIGESLKHLEQMVRGELNLAMNALNRRKPQQQ